jgi:hypothetical protein
VTTQISELGRAQRRRRAVGTASDGAAVATIEPVPRIALTQQEACASLGCSEEFFVEHVRPYLRVGRRGLEAALPGRRAAARGRRNTDLQHKSRFKAGNPASRSQEPEAI